MLAPGRAGVTSMESFGTSGLKVHTRLVGRAAELRWLEECLQEAIVGRPRFVLLQAEAGVGKTRLEMEVCERARQAQVQIALGRAEEHLSIPFGLLAEALEPHLESETGDAGGVLTLAKRLLSGSRTTAALRNEDEAAEQMEHIRAL